jgi:hypothetical protein
MFFCWLALQNRLWAADRIIKHGGQSDGICRLCYTHPESVLHLIAGNSPILSRGVEWPTGLARDCLATLSGQPISHLQDMVEQHDQDQRSERRPHTSAMSCFTAWHLWKERCRRVFHSKGICIAHLQELIWHDVQQWMVAWHGREQHTGAPG